MRTGDLSVSDGGVGARQDTSGRTPESRTTGTDIPTADDAELTDDAPVLAPNSDPDTTSLLDVRV